MSNLVYPLHPDSPTDAQTMGGKGANLVHLIKAGFEVPDGCVLTTKLFSSYHTNVNNHSNKIINETLTELITAALRDFPESTQFAVRSSGSDEDAGDTSFAGQHDTILNVVGIVDIVQAVRDCWRSIEGEAAVAYRKSHGNDTEATMAVVIQKMVDAKCAGVMFTRHPVRPDLDRVVIEGVSGLGEALVSGEVTPDLIELDRNGERLLTDINSPDGKLCLDILGDLDFVALANKLEAYFNKPQDIEWAFDGHTFFLLQARPITTLKRPETAWSRIGADEVWAGATTPLQFTCLGRWILEDNFRAVAKISGFDHLETIEPFERIHSHIYFNADYIRSTIPMIPPSLRIPRFFLYLPPYWLAEMPNQPQRKMKAVKGQVLAMFRDKNSGMFSHYKKLDNYIEGVQNALQPILADDLTQLNDKALWQRMLRADEFGQTHFHFIRWGMTTYLLPLKLIVIRSGMSWAGDKHGYESEMLLTAEEDNRTIRVNHDLKKLGNEAASIPQLKQLLLDSDTPVTLEQVLEIYGADNFIIGLRQFLAEHGHRGTTRELHLPRWMDDPSLVLGLITAYVDSTDREQSKDCKEAIRSKTEQWLERIGKSSFWFGWLRKIAVRKLLSVARAYTAYRESQRYALDFILTEMRHTMCEISDRLVRDNKLQTPDDIFFLTFDELKLLWTSYQDGSSFTMPDVDGRRTEFEEDEKQLPANWIIDGQEYGTQSSSQLNENTFAGTSASSGKYTGIARVVHGPHELRTVRQDEIMVAPNTDPGWTPVFPLINGLVLETGGMLSHGAIVAREYGIPAVTGVLGACSAIETGMRLSVDGNSGRVEILERNISQTTNQGCLNLNEA